MAGPYFYFQLQGGTDQLVCDTTVMSITFPQIDRNYTAIPLFSNGAVITGNGSLRAGELMISAKMRNNGTYAPAWNAFRYALMKWIGVAKYQNLYFYIVDANGTTLTQKVFPLVRGSENYSSIAISDETSFTFQMEKAYFYNPSAVTSSFTSQNTQLQAFSVTNNGMIPVAPLFAFTPTANFTTFQIQILMGYGFTLTSTFLANQTITFDCATGLITVNGSIVSGIQTSGSIFDIATGINNLYITATTGTLLTSINERYI